MSELSKTNIFFVVALATLALAVFTKPSSREYNVEEVRGTELVKEFPTDAPKRLEITTRDEETGDLKEFEVAELDGVWSIPSRSGYPADATEQMAAAVEGVVGREILDVFDAGSGDHAKYGVVDPMDAGADEGFGTHVQLTDADDKALADLIIGNEVEGRPGQRYVRKEKQDVVYQVEVDLDKFSTDFGSWIEKDLLQLSSFDVSQVYIDDYSIEMRLVIDRGRIRPDFPKELRSRMQLKYNDADSKWIAESLETYDEQAGEYVPFELADDQELNADALREFKNALDDLTIVDVEKKPDGLSADLRTGADFMNRIEGLESLAQRGFLPLPKDPSDPNSGYELKSGEGEIVVTLNDGVEYVLRFGNLQLDTEVAEGEQPPAEEEEAKVEGNGEGLNRYLFVMARFDESAIEKPTLEELPELPAEESTTEAAETEDSSAEDEDAAEEGEGAEEAEGSEQGEEAAEEEPQPSRDEIKAERARIKLNNQRAEDEYNEKVEAGQKRVEELNARFGDWYYVIPNDVFKKIHLGRDQVIKSAEPDEGETAQPDASAFGAPGAAIPGLPEIVGGQGTPAAEAPAESETAEEAASADEAESADEPDTDPTGEGGEGEE